MLLSQAKNGDQLFWEEKFHAANGKAQACTQGALLFFLISFVRGVTRISFHFALVPNGFPSGSPFLNVFPNMFSIAPHFYPICFGKCFPPFTHVGGRKGRNAILQNRTFYYREPPYM